MGIFTASEDSEQAGQAEGTARTMMRKKAGQPRKGWRETVGAATGSTEAGLGEEREEEGKEEGAGQGIDQA